MTARIELGDADAARAERDAIAGIYREAFSREPWSEPQHAIEGWVGGRFAAHREREGFEVALARVDDEVVGFAYGFTGRAGSFWPEYVRTIAGDETADEWVVGQFELVELAVDERARGLGVGRRLLDELLSSRDEDRVASQTLAEETPARALYRAAGFRDLAFDDRYVIIGAEL